MREPSEQAKGQPQKRDDHYKGGEWSGQGQKRD